jgi:TolB-like protein/DNA-binding winged helix-turn-helix (wHTH) protein/Tfp pilus assembly protein PilF
MAAAPGRVSIDVARREGSMAATGTAGERYRLGDLTVDVGLQQVTGPAGDIALPRLSFDLLLALLRRAPDFVSNDELSATVWAGVVVSPETVTKRVNLLREAIGDDASNPRYVAGLRSRGYRIVATVERLEGGRAASLTHHAAASPASANDSTPPAREQRRDTRRLLLLAAAFALVVSGVWWAWHARDVARPKGLYESHVLTPADSAVAVLRFRNLSPDPADAYLAAGVPEMILDRLATLPGLTVIASGSALAIESGAQDPRVTGEKLGVRYLIEGSAQREGDSLRITARLVDARTGTQIWSAREDRPLAELFMLQDSIANNVTEALSASIKGLADLRPVAPTTPVIEAQLAFLQGRVLLARGTVADSVAAIAKFEHATTLDPQFAAAFAGLYDAYMLAAERRHDDVAAERKKRAPLIERALSLDPACGSAYVARAIWSDADDESRERDFTRGLELDPSNSRGLLGYSTFLRNAGRFDESSKAIDRALQVDPMSPHVHFMRVQRKFRTDGGLSLEQGMRRVLDIDPDYQPALQRYAKYRWMHHGMLAEAARIIEHAIEVDPENPWSRQTAAAIYLDLGDPVTARRIAAATASSRATAEILLSMQSGDWRTAGELAMGEPGRRYNLFESWGVPEAVRDWALNTGDLQRGIAYLEERYGLASGGEFGLSNFRAAACLVHLLQLSGQTDRARDLLDVLPPTIEATIPKDGPVYALRTLAILRMLKGDRAGALAKLGESFRANDLMQWWYTLERDPVWAPVRHSAEFKAIEREVRARVDHERASLARSPSVSDAVGTSTPATAKANAGS